MEIDSTTPFRRTIQVISLTTVPIVASLLSIMKIPMLEKNRRTISIWFQNLSKKLVNICSNLFPLLIFHYAGVYKFLIDFCERSILPVKSRDLEPWPSTSSNVVVKISGNETDHLLPPTLFIPLLPSSMPLIQDHSSKISVAQPTTTALTECKTVSLLGNSLTPIFKIKLFKQIL